MTLGNNKKAPAELGLGIERWAANVVRVFPCRVWIYLIAR